MYGMPPIDFDCKIKPPDGSAEPVELTTPYGKVSGSPEAIAYLKSLMNDDIDSALELLAHADKND